MEYTKIIIMYSNKWVSNEFECKKHYKQKHGGVFGLQIFHNKDVH